MMDADISFFYPMAIFMLILAVCAYFTELSYVVANIKTEFIHVWHIIEAMVFVPPMVKVFFYSDRRLSMLVLILFCVATYFYSSHRRRLAQAGLELVVNCFLLTGVVLCIVFTIRLKDWLQSIPFCLAPGVLFLVILIKNYAMARKTIHP